MLKRITILMLLAALAVSLAGAKIGLKHDKTYTFLISSPTYAGDVQLKRGEYRVKVTGSEAVLIDKDGRPVDAKVTLQPAERNFDQTALVINTQDGVTRIVEVHLGKTSNVAVFQ